jgi:hypothetical protein
MDMVSNSHRAFLRISSMAYTLMKQPLKGVMTLLLMGAFTWIYYLSIMLARHESFDIYC